MDDLQIITQTLNSTVQRAARQAQNYEIEIVNLTAEIVKLQGELERRDNEIQSLRAHVEVLKSQLGKNAEEILPEIVSGESDKIE